MIKRRIPLLNVSTVAASTTAIIELPIGPRYHHLILEHGYASGTNTIAATATNLSEIKIKVNGRDQRTMTGTQLRALNNLMGAVYDPWTASVPNTAPGVGIPIFFAEPWRKQPAAQELTAWCTRSKRHAWDSFQVHVTLGAASTPTLIAWAVVDDFIPDGPLNIVKWLRHGVGASGTSFDWSLPDRRDYLQQLSVWEPTIANSAHFTRMTLRRNSETIHDLTLQANTALLYQYGMTPVALTGGRYDIVLDHDDLLGSAVPLDGVNDLTLTMAAGDAMTGTATVIQQRMGPPE